LHTKNSRSVSILRNVTHIYNEAACFRCHPASQKNLGLLFVDYSTADTDALISSTLVRLLFAAVVACIMISLLVSYIANHLIHKPIAMLIDGTNEIKGGKYHRKISCKGSNEFNTLADSFNDMSEQLEISRDQLEERILERTNELNITNERLTREITEHKQAEEALRKSEEQYRAIFEESVAVVYVFDAQKNFINSNQAGLDLLGYSRAELLHMSIPDVDYDPDVVLPAHQELSSGGRLINYEHQLRRKDGTIITVLNNSRPLTDLKGNVVGMLSTLTDITERKRAEEDKQRLEERLQRSEKMEALGQLAGGVAHDLNNVLGILSGYSELLLDEIPEEHRARGHVQKILQSTEKGAAIIQDLLTLARRGVTVSEVINLNSVVSDFLQSPVYEKINNYHPLITFRTDCEKDLLNIKGSPVHLEKTLMNLVSNAAEAITGTGEVTIRTESRYLDRAIKGYDEVREGDYVIMAVTDTGTGIPAKDREKIFEPFYTKKKMGRSGTGLGLAIVWGTVKDHHGYIDIQSEVGQGTTFTLYFPVTRDELISPQQKKTIEQYMGNGEVVLVVDDIAEQREIAEKLLAKLGYEVHQVGGGEEAVEYIKGNTVDMLVLDMIMPPGIDGLETYRRILEINPKQKATIVSGFSETDRIRKAQKLGAGAYVKKPYTIEKIGVAIRDALINNVVRKGGNKQ
jgi:PAS domain S-box-containing protein